MVRSRPEADPDVLGRLADARLTARGFLANASNHTLLVQVGDAADGLHAVYKPRRGERPLWDFPHGTLCQREAAAYVVSHFLGWDLVPPTVLRDGPMGVGSVQLFVPHDPELHYFALVEAEQFHGQLARMATFDLLINNADRKASHVILSEEDDRLLGVDHGLTFHPHAKLRTVIWDLERTAIEQTWREDLRRLHAAVQDTQGALATALAGLLSAEEIEALRLRAEILARMRALPSVEPDRRPYPWPPL